MKFWQLTSIFRDEINIIEDEFNKDEWNTYLNIYNNLQIIVKNQRRDLLDMKVDDTLLKKICIKSKKKIYGCIDGYSLFSYRHKDIDKEFTIAEAIDIFDHDTIEEVFEKTSSVAKRKY